MPEIVKVQQPIMTSEPDRPWLLYDRNHKHVVSLPEEMIPQRIRYEMGPAPKAYYWGEFSSLGVWVLDRRTEPQKW